MPNPKRKRVPEAKNIQPVSSDEGLRRRMQEILTPAQMEAYEGFTSAISEGRMPERSAVLLSAWNRVAIDPVCKMIYASLGITIRPVDDWPTAKLTLSDLLHPERLS